MKSARHASLLLSIAALVVLPSCTCRKPTDDEKLRALIDTTPVHLWLSAKIAARADDTAPKETLEAKRALGALVVAARHKERPKVDPNDAASIAIALWQMRGFGKEALRKFDPKAPPPILAELMHAPEPLREVLDPNLEHALFLVGLSVAKVHPKLAVPVPPELLLYEAWATDASKLTLPSLAPIVRSTKAWVYGNAELCDLAEREGSAVPESGDLFLEKPLESDLLVLLGRPVDVDGRALQQAGAAFATLANGATAVCFFQRGEPEKANPALRRVVDTAEAHGVRSREQRFLRGYVECATGDPKRGDEALRAVEADAATPPRLKDASAILRSRCGQAGPLAKVLDRTALAAAFTMLALAHLEESGLIDTVVASDVAKTVTAVVTSASGSVDRSKMPTSDGIGRRIGEWFRR